MIYFVKQPLGGTTTPNGSPAEGATDIFIPLHKTHVLMLLSGSEYQKHKICPPTTNLYKNPCTRNKLDVYYMQLQYLLDVNLIILLSKFHSFTSFYVIYSDDRKEMFIQQLVSALIKYLTWFDQISNIQRL